MLGLDCVGNENTIRREPCKRSRMRSRKPCRIGGKIHILEAHADHEMMSLTHVGLRKNAKPGPEQTRPPKYWNLNKKTKTTVPNDRAKPQRPMPGWSSKKLEKNLQTPCKETKPSLNTEPACTARCQENEIASPKPLYNWQKNDYLSRERNHPPTPPNPPNPPLKTLKQLVPLSPQNTKFTANEGDGTCI